MTREIKIDDLDLFFKQASKNKLGDSDDYIKQLFLNVVEGIIEMKKNKINKYIVCNQDEPYAEKVWQVMLEGEKEKQRREQKNEYNTR